MTNPITHFRSQISTMTSEFRNALPSHIKPEKFQRIVMTVVGQNPDLLAADRKTLLASCLKCAADGLIPDGREAALVIFKTKIKDDGRDRWISAVQYMPMLAGIQKRVRNSGDIASIQAHVIYEKDRFVWKQGVHECVEHEPFFPGNRGKPIGAYAIARFKDGSDPQVEVMSYAEIEAVRNVSKSKDFGPWKTWWGEMARKTVFRRLSKWLPMDTDVDELISRQDEPAVIDHEPQGSGPAELPTESITDESSSKLDALETSEGLFDSETGELVKEGAPS